jgi:hypothetical protein
MTASIVALGQSAKDWHQVPHDFSVGVNDAAMWGKDPDHLVIVNFERKFHSKRLEVIKGSKSQVWTHTNTWKKHFPGAKVIKLSPFSGWFRKGMYYSLRTSPIVAMSVAVNLGADKLILFGVDFRSHKSFNAGEKRGDHEMRQYFKFFEALKKVGVEVYLGGEGSALESYLPKYEVAV